MEDHMKKTSTRVLLMFAALALFIVPVVAFAAAGFIDVDDDNVFVADIQWMKDNGITKGCNPPTNDKFCPKNTVTREQMSAFMHRLATSKVVDAATAAHADHATEADLLVGNFKGHIQVYANVGEVRAPRFESRGLLQANGEDLKIHNW